MSRLLTPPPSPALRRSRRALLKSIGAAVPAVALPLLRSSPLYAQAAPVRLVVLFKANGTILDSFWPSNPGPAYTIPGGGILEPLMPLRPKLNILKGVHYDSGDKFVNAAAHQKGPVACLTGGGANTGPFGGGNGNSSGYGNNISIDQYLASKWGVNTHLKTLEIGVGIKGVSNRNRISYLGNNQPVGPEGDPARAFARVFGNFTPAAAPAADPAAGQQEVMKTLAARRSVLDFVRGDLARLEARLPADERGRLQRHLESLRELERSLSNPGAGGMAGAACKPAAGMPGADYVAQSKAQLDLVHQTLACDQTRLITFIWTGETSQQTYPWLGFNDAHHDMSHKPDGDAATKAKLIKVNRWFAEQVFYLLSKMDAVTEANGKTMLDNSLVVFTDGLGKGNNHSRKNIPWVLAGGAGGAIPTGKFFDFGNKPHNHLLVSILHAMGLRNETFFGHPSLKEWSGPLPGLVA
jgi:hypothetical protein